MHMGAGEREGSMSYFCLHNYDIQGASALIFHHTLFKNFFFFGEFVCWCRGLKGEHLCKPQCIMNVLMSDFSSYILCLIMQI